MSTSALCRSRHHQASPPQILARAGKRDATLAAPGSWFLVEPLPSQGIFCYWPLPPQVAVQFHVELVGLSRHLMLRLDLLKWPAMRTCFLSVKAWSEMLLSHPICASTAVVQGINSSPLKPQNPQPHIVACPVHPRRGTGIQLASSERPGKLKPPDPHQTGRSRRQSVGHERWRVCLCRPLRKIR